MRVYIVKFIHNIERILISDVVNNDLPDIEYIILGFISCTVGLRLRTGAIGKSFFAMQLAMCLADTTGTTNMLSLVSSKRCKVGYVNAEDPELILKYRIKNIATKNIFASVCITDKYNA
ncbi:AAA family ATPase [Candidatus Acidulodesulfobacterium sp. H_13]|uniref:AAA family ATPase n=1 Tax=Candidatus Acidulodesulfobacterium sp. H_13 TaxID=3395470 RepID=UPI003AF4B6C3